MPNKYSHAIVLSNYQSHGLIELDASRPSKDASSSNSSKSSANSAKFKTQSSPSIHSSSIYGPAERLRLGSPTRTRSKPVPPPLHRKSSSVETKIFAPLDSPTPPPTRDAHSLETKSHKAEYKAPSQTASERNGSPSSKMRAYTRHERYAPQGSSSPPITQRHEKAVYFKPQKPTPKRSLPPESKAELRDEYSTEIRDFAFQHLPPAGQPPNWRHSSAVAIGEQGYTSSDTIRASAVRRYNDSHSLKGFGQPLRIPHDRYGRIPFAAQAFAPERPPSPPATPDSEKSFSLETPIEKPDPITSPPPIPERSARRSPPGPSPKPCSPTSSILTMRIEPLRPKTSPTQSTPRSPTGKTFSITTRTSSLNAATTTPSNARTFSMPSEPVFDDDTKTEALPGIFDMSSEPFAIDDADLESLPSTYTPSSPDFNIEPWSDDSAGPAIFRDGELNSPRPSTAGQESTRASSFDSAAPPPVGMNKRMPPVLTEIISSSTPKAPKSQKKSTTLLASLAFFRSAPKAVLYSQTMAGTPPLPVSVSRTAVPSVPALFPCYKSPFPPPGKICERSGRASRDGNRPKQMRGRSVPPRASERRRSWFKADPFERPTGLCRQASEREGKQTLKNLQYLGWC